MNASDELEKTRENLTEALENFSRVRTTSDSSMGGLPLRDEGLGEFEVIWRRFLNDFIVQHHLEEANRFTLGGMEYDYDVNDVLLSDIVHFQELSEYVRQPSAEGFHLGRVAWGELVQHLNMLASVLLAWSGNSVPIDRSQGDNSHLTASQIQALQEIQDEVIEHRKRVSVGWAEIAASRSAERAHAANVSAQEAKEHALSAAAETSTNRLTSDYESYGLSQRRAATGFRVTTIITIIAAIVGPFLVHANVTTGSDVAKAVTSLALALGLVGLAGYFARQAHLHRTLATWAESITIQLLTFEAFIDPIQDPDRRDELRSNFANRVFGPQPKLKGEPPVTAAGPVLDSLLTKFAKASS
ncbi:hypothetical protein [Arthrobacter sp. N199823]|uniref:hypothetical protein n=1 Tax=Arthrobacter sp. N199823 TaxID=2058895 RepID=UPI000CE47A9D|nr:hypothetical protein [Arthrobacter sp. N199823]